MRKYTDNMSENRPAIMTNLLPIARFEGALDVGLRSLFLRREGLPSVSCCVFFLNEFPFPDIETIRYV